jgi:chromosome partitioning protein
MTRILAIANQKGGVGKTTTAINLAAALAELGNQVLVVDLDPQGNASTGLGVEAEKRRQTTYDLLVSEALAHEVIQPTLLPRVWISAANADLSSADIELSKMGQRTFRLRHALRAADERLAHFDYILIDCPPSLNLLTLNAMIAADSILVPLQAEYFALEGLSQLLQTIRSVRESANNNLRIEGVLLTMYDKRNNLAQQVEQDAREHLGDLVFQTVVPRNVRISEAPSFGTPVIVYDPTSKGSQAYRALAHEMMARSGALA